MRTTTGLTLLEMVVAITMTLVLTISVARVVTPAPSRRAADAYVHAAQRQRLTALLTSTPMGMRYDPLTVQFVRYAGASDCSTPDTVTLPVPRGVSVTRTLRDGVMWLPSGSGRSCRGGGVYGGRIRFEDQREAWDVIVASSGRLRTERAR